MPGRGCRSCHAHMSHPSRTFLPERMSPAAWKRQTNAERWVGCWGQKQLLVAPHAGAGLRCHAVPVPPTWAGRDGHQHRAALADRDGKRFGSGKQF